jgi:DNA-binding response OmpR family regulator
VTGRILLAEGDAVLGDLYRATLENDGWNVEIVNQAEAALSRVLASPPDLLLLNSVPGVSRRAVLQQIRSHSPTRDLPVILLSDSGLDLDQELVREMGALAMLVKGLATRQELAATVRNLLQARAPAAQDPDPPAAMETSAEPA